MAEVRMTCCTDHRGLTITTDSAEAAAHYREGLQLLVGSSPEALPALRAAVAADPGLGVALAALILCVSASGDRDDALMGALGRALDGSTRATRRERQHIEIIAGVVRGDSERARALAQDHLVEFPDDVLIEYVLRGR
jgi:hypothetical protein